MAKKKAEVENKAKPSGNGKDGNGRFVKGNTLGNGGKDHKATSQGRILKSALCGAITRQDIEDIAKGLIAKAKKGDVLAARELFDRLWGRAPQAITGEDGGPIEMQMINFAGLKTE